MSVTIDFDNSYARLPERLFARVSPTKVQEPRIIKVNHALAEQLRLDPSELDSAEGAQVLSGNRLPEGAASIALAYAGHQFGGFSPQLGDGRAILLGEVLDRDGARRDIQLKGAGRTPFSRGGDGRAALGPVLREYIVSEAMFALGVPTTRALAAVTTGETVIREQRLPGAVFTRVAASHIRVGTFEFFAARSDRDAVAELTKYTLARHYPLPSAEQHTPESEALRLLERVIEAQASLVARWLGLGFVHGVMNTDNTSISGETIDYGPCAFLDEYDPDKTFSSIDHGGRYAFGNQPRIALWNLARFAETLLPLIAEKESQAVEIASERLQRYSELFESARMRVLRSKLGLASEDAGDAPLIEDLLQRLAKNHVDYTVFFRALCAAAEDPVADARVAALFEDQSAFAGFAERWRQRLRLEQLTPEARARSMRLANPAFIPRNHRIEQAIAAGVTGNYEPFETLVRVLARPYEEQPEFEHLAEPPLESERVRATFCGT
ncbi:MAG TPA: YdiU family protein [Polyangiaceae bacterium]|nr:YdiU family protein [Polyangiaceae bacterium]